MMKKELNSYSRLQLLRVFGRHTKALLEPNYSADQARNGADGTVNASGKRHIKRLLKKAAFIQIVDDLCDGRLVLVEPDGVTLYGSGGREEAGFQGENESELHPVVLEDETVCYVAGASKAATAAVLISTMLAAEEDKRDLIAETLSKYREINLFYTITEKLATSLDLRDVAHLAIGETLRMVPADSASMMLFDDKTGHLQIVAEIGERCEPKAWVEVGKGISGSVISSGKAEIVNDVQGDARYVEGGAQVRSLMCAPFRPKDTVLGVITMGRSDGPDFTAMELKLLSAITMQVTPIIENARLFSNLKKSEERFRQIFEQNDDAIILIDAKNNMMFKANPAAEKLYGHTHDELLAMKPETLLDTAEREQFAQIMANIGKTRGFRLAKTVFLRRNGDRVFVSMRGKLMRLENRDVVYCSIRDISEKVRMQLEVEAFQSKLISSNKLASLGMLVSGVVHEINNPNNFISVNSSLLATIWDKAFPILERYAAEEGDFELAGMPFERVRDVVPKLFSGLKKGSTRIKDIVDNLKGISKDDNRHCESKVDMIQVVHDALTIIGHQIKHFTDNFTLDHPKSAVFVYGNHQQLEQVIINLIMNALQSLPDKRCGIRVSVGHSGKTRVIMAVQDEGRGIGAEIIERITEPFFSTRLDEGGTGLGLSISASIIKDHGGSIKFISHVDKGTKVMVSLRRYFE
jgi:PAS domain S-box-containing protein